MNTARSYVKQPANSSKSAKQTVTDSSNLVEPKEDEDYASRQARERATTILGNHQLLMKYAVENRLVSTITFSRKLLIKVAVRPENSILFRTCCSWL